MNLFDNRFECFIIRCVHFNKFAFFNKLECRSVVTICVFIVDSFMSCNGFVFKAISSGEVFVIKVIREENFYNNFFVTIEETA